MYVKCEGAVLVAHHVVFGTEFVVAHNGLDEPDGVVDGDKVPVDEIRKTVDACPLNFKILEIYLNYFDG